MPREKKNAPEEQINEETKITPAEEKQNSEEQALPEAQSNSMEQPSTNEFEDKDCICVMPVQVTDRKRHSVVNVRDDNGEIIGSVANGSLVMVDGYDAEADKQHIHCFDFHTTEPLFGTIPTQNLKSDF